MSVKVKVLDQVWERLRVGGQVKSRSGSDGMRAQVRERELTCGELADRNILNALYAECQPQRVVRQPVLLQAIPRAEGGAEGEADHLRDCDGQVYRLL